MEPINTTRCRQCGNKFPAGPSRDGICPQCRSSLPTDDAQPNADQASTSTSDFLSTRVLPDHIGPYKILDFLGEGGMGVVYLAEQEQPIRRKVALKVVKLGMDTKEVIARFESERQALAMMNHPNIAQVHDAGTTERGAPYFVMEHVAGIPITDYCDKHRLSTRERLEIFIPVCQAIQHAHQKGIIHRDIKPSNILVTVQDGKAAPKIIDFGVAKATNQRLTEKTVFTQQGYLIGTPEYMSPEQAEMTGLDVDTTTDIYSLGVLLYQLLVGALPFDAGRLRRAGYDEIRRIIREEEPPKPTTRLSSLGQSGNGIAERRRTDVASLTKDLRGDLDWVTMKAMEKDRMRRYASSSELAADIERHLKNEPVLACPPGSAYRVRKFVRRHRMGVSIAAAAVVVLIAFVVMTLVQAKRVARERDRANREADSAKQVSDFLVGLFKVSDPREARGNTVTAREILDRGASKVDQNLKDRPLEQARLMNTMGRVYDELGLYEQALPLLESALAARRRVLGEEHLDVAESLADLGTAKYHTGEYDVARSLIEQSMAIRNQLLGPESPLVASSLHDLGTLRYSRGEYDAARALLERALAIREKITAGGADDVANTLNSLGAIAFKSGNYTEAGRLWERTLAIREKTLSPNHPLIAQTLNNIAVLHTSTGDAAGARPLLERAVRIQEKVLGPKHPDLASGLMNVGDIVLALGDDIGAKAYYARAVAILEEINPGNPELARSLDGLAGITLRQGDAGAARHLYERSLALREKVLGPKHPEAAYSMTGLAECARRQGREKEAQTLYERALTLSRNPNGSYYAGAADTLDGYAALLGTMGQKKHAAEMKALATSLRKPPSKP